MLNLFFVDKRKRGECDSISKRDADLVHLFSAQSSQVELCGARIPLELNPKCLVVLKLVHDLWKTKGLSTVEKKTMLTQSMKINLKGKKT